MTLLSRVFGYIRDLLQASILGAADLSDAYIIAFRIPNLLRRLVGEGALTAAFIPVFTSTSRQEGESAAWQFASAAFWTLAVILLAVSALGMLAAPWLVRLLAMGFSGIGGKMDLTVHLTQVMFPYLLFIGLAAMAMAMLNSVGVFAAPAFTPVLLNLSIITSALLFARKSSHPAFWFAAGVLVGGALQLTFQIPFLLRRGFSLRPRLAFRDSRVRQVGRLMLPGIFGVGVTQINLIVDSQIASFLGSGSVSYLYYAIRVEELVLGVFVISLSTVILPLLSRHAAEGRDDRLRSAVERGLRLVFYITIPAMLGLWILKEPIIRTLFQHGSFTAADTQLTSWALALYGLGLLPTGLVKILAPAFYARLDTATPVKVGAAAFALHIPVCILLARFMGHAGIALSTSLAASVNAGALLWILTRREKADWMRRLTVAAGRMILPALVMGATILSLLRWTRLNETTDILAQVGILVCLVAAGATIYITLCHLLGSPEGRRLWAELRGKLEGRAAAGS